MLALQLLKLNASSRPPTAPRKTPNLLLLPSFLAKSRNIATSSPSALSPLRCAPTPTTMMRRRFFLSFPASAAQHSLGLMKSPKAKNYPLRTDYLAFKTAMSDIYLDQNYRELCETKLNALRQTKSAAAYSVEFATLSAPLSLNDEALCLNFYRGLHDDVKDRMAIVGRAST